jgi:pimeloyl-ACP methyl ester carboxylesterase
MFVHESGPVDGPAIVFLHGNGVNGTMWKAHMDRLTAYHCLAPDFPGFGRSNGEEWVSLDHTACQVVEVIRTRTAHAKAHVVGLSLGGSTIIKLLSQAPELIDHAIVDGAGVLPLRGLPFIKLGLRAVQPLLRSDRVIRIIAKAMNIRDDNYDDFIENMLCMSPASYTRAFIQALSMRQPPGLEKVTCPVLFVSGEKEPGAVKRSNVMLARLMPKSQSRMVPRLTHAWGAVEAVDLNIRMVEAWLQDRPLPAELVAVKF